MDEVARRESAAFESAPANALAASRLKKYTPGLSATRTYVRTFNSGNAESTGSAGTKRGATFDMWKGTIPIHALP